MDGNNYILQKLAELGIKQYVGVNGGGVIHFLGNLDPGSNAQEKACFKTISEYSAGFVPLGSYLASGKIAATVVTTGAAAKLAGSGISDAKIHNIPSVFIIALNSTTSVDKSPLQDVTPYGANIIHQIRAELEDGCIVLDTIEELDSKLETARAILADSRPVALLFHPDVLCETVPEKTKAVSSAAIENEIYEPSDRFVQSFLETANNRRVVICVSEEAAREPSMPHLSKKIAERLRAPVVWSVNGANGVSEDNPYGYGYISFGGNCRALQIWESLDKDDVVLLLGFEPTEYVTNLRKIDAGFVWHLSNIKKAYGSKNRRTVITHIIFLVNTIKFTDVFRIVFWPWKRAWKLFPSEGLKPGYSMNSISSFIRKKI